MNEEKKLETYVTRKQLADIFGVDPVTIDNYVKQGLKRLKNKRFGLNASINWLNEEK